MELVRYISFPVRLAYYNIVLLPLLLLYGPYPIKIAIATTFLQTFSTTLVPPIVTIQSTLLLSKSVLASTNNYIKVSNCPYRLAMLVIVNIEVLHKIFCMIPISKQNLSCRTEHACMAVVAVQKRIHILVNMISIVFLFSQQLTDSQIFPHCGIAAALPRDRIHTRPLVKLSCVLASPRSLKVI